MNHVLPPKIPSTRRLRYWRLPTAVVMACVLGISCESEMWPEMSMNHPGESVSDIQTNECHDFNRHKDSRFNRVISEHYFTGSDGTPRRYKKYEHRGGDDAFVIFLHGRGGFAERYDALFTSLNGYPGPDVPIDETLADLPITFFSVDLAGHGKSAGLKGHIDRVNTYVEDLKQLIDSIPRLKYHTKPIYLMSHSTGGLITALFAQQYPEYVDALISNAPAYGIEPPPGVPAQALQQLVNFYVQAGLDTLCTTPAGIDVPTLGAIAACHGDPTLNACFNDPSMAICETLTNCLFQGLPNDCGAPPIDFSGLHATFDYLYTLEDGCQVGRDPIPACTFGGSDFAGTTTDFDYCIWSESHPLAGVSPTMGWVKAMYAGIAQLSPAINVPTLILATPIDPIATYQSQVDMCSAMPDCTLAVFPPVPDQNIYFFHQMLLEQRRSEVISAIRNFINTLADNL